MAKLLMSGRTMGYAVDRYPAPDQPPSYAIVVLQVSADRADRIAIVAHKLKPANSDDAVGWFALELDLLVERALFYGAPKEEVRGFFTFGAKEDSYHWK